MTKHQLDHFCFFQLIFSSDVEMLISCDCCVKLNCFCILSDKSEKCNECVMSKKSCSFLSQFFYHQNVLKLLKAREKIDKDHAAAAEKKEYLLEALLAVKAKSCCLEHQSQFLKEHDDKLIQESTEVFEKELHVLKNESSSAVFLNNSSSDFLIIKMNADLVFSALFSDF